MPAATGIDMININSSMRGCTYRAQALMFAGEPIVAAATIVVALPRWSRDNFVIDMT
ncbi:MAG: hypothetical protein AB7V46_05230 [Thermomicrobiales bacterium]